jgi:HSP20 family protein
MRPDRTGHLHSLFFPAEAARAAWQPSADVYRTRTGWLIKLDLAGVRPEDVQVSVSGNRLTVRGSRRDWCLEEGCCHYQMEISYSQFERSITLPDDLQRARLGAEYRHGLLLIDVQLEAAK